MDVIFRTQYSIRIYCSASKSTVGSVLEQLWHDEWLEGWSNAAQPVRAINHEEGLVCTYAYSAPCMVHANAILNIREGIGFLAHGHACWSWLVWPPAGD